MKKAGLKALSILLAVLFVCSVCTVAFATDVDTPADEEIPTRYTTISSHVTSFYISGVTANCKATLNAKKSASLKIGMTLQKKTSSGYTNVQNWTANGTGVYLALSKTKTINPLSTYRLKVTFTAGSESVTTYHYG